MIPIPPSTDFANRPDRPSARVLCVTTSPATVTPLRDALQGERFELHTVSKLALTDVIHTPVAALIIGPGATITPPHSLTDLLRTLPWLCVGFLGPEARDDFENQELPENRIWEADLSHLPNTFARDLRKNIKRAISTYADLHTGDDFSISPEVRLMGEMTDATFQQSDLTAMLKKMASGLADLLGGAGVGVLVREFKSHWIMVIHNRRPLPEIFLDDVGRSLIDHFYQLAPENISESRLKVIREGAGSEGQTGVPSPWLPVPVVSDGEVLGVMVVDPGCDSTEGRSGIGFAHEVAHHLSTTLIALQNMQDLLITDPMTGCYNRWFMDVELARMCELASQSSHSFALMLLDVDHFKQINDTYGHHVGDQFLVELVTRIREIIRPTDALMRFGGDEFLLLFPRAGRKDITSIAERMVAMAREKLRIPDGGDQLSSVSMGIVIHEPDREEQPKEVLLERVDQALYASKRRGRDRYTIWDPSLMALSSDADENGASACLAEEVRALQARLDETTRELAEAREFSINVMNSILDAKEFETGLHSMRVTKITEFMIEKLNVPEEQRRGILQGARLHDIGKIAIPDHILHKQGGFTESEWAIMRRHPEIGYRFVESSPFLKEAADIILHHHEAYDGSGYPHGLKGEAIPIGARIFTLVDVYDSMRSNRVYKESISCAATVEEIRDKAGIQFDPGIVEVFLRHIPEIERIGHWSTADEPGNHA